MTYNLTPDPAKPLKSEPSSPLVTYAILAALLLAVGFTAPPVAAAELCAGLVQDKLAHAMSALAKPALGQAIVDPQFGTTIRRITAVPVAEGSNAVIKPVYSTMPAWNADESLLILWHRGKDHELYDGKTYAFIRPLSELFNGSSPTDIEQVFWDPINPLTLYFPSNYNALPYLYRVRLSPDGKTSTKSVARDFSDICPKGDSSKPLSAGTDPFWMSWGGATGPNIGLECGTTKFVYDIANNKVLGKSTISGIDSAPAVAGGGSLAYLGGKVYDMNNGALRLVRTLSVGSPDEHSSVGRSGIGADTYNTVAFDAASGWSQLDSVGTLVTYDLGTGAFKVVIGMKTGYPYPPSGTHVSAVATQAPGWVGVSVVGATSAAKVLDGEVLLANVDTGIVCRVAHHRTWGSNGKWGYWSEPHVNISRTGTRLLFGSDWGNGSSVDTYVVELPGYKGAPLNKAPAVVAGVDQTVTLPSPASLAGSVSDDGLPTPPGVVTSQWSKLSGPGAVSFTNPASLTTTATFSVDGVYTLRLTASDGALSASDDVVVTVKDTTPPAVDMTSPANGATVAGTVAVAATASDNVAVVGVQFLLDGVAIGAEDTSAPYSVSWDTIAAANGTHVLSAAARDAAGNSTTSTSRSVTIANDTTPPAVDLTSPTDGATVAGSVTVGAMASDNVAVVGVQFLLDGVALGAEDTNAPWGASWDTTATANGNHVLSATARDAAGNSTTSTSRSVTIANDTTPPTVDITSPSDGATVAGTVGVAAVAADDVAVVGVQFMLDGVAMGAEVTSPPYGLSWNTNTAADGTYVLSAAARDAAGNWGVGSSRNVLVSNQAANLPPVANAGPNQTIRFNKTKSASLAGSASDDGLPNPPGVLSFSWSLVSGPAAVSFANATNAATTVTFSKTGTYVLQLMAEDGALTASDKVKIMVK